MASQTLRKSLEAGELLLGCAVTYPEPAIIESIAGPFDWVWIDAQHGLWNRASAANAVRAADLVGTASVIRVPGHEYGVIGPFLDLAPKGVMVPMVDTPDEARRVVEAVRFPPLGKRSFGGRRVGDLYGRDYPAVEEAAPLLIAQIETPLGVANVEAIAATPGIDVLLFGAADFQLRLGLPMGLPQRPAQVDEAAKTIMDACTAHGVFGGIVCGNDQVLATAVGMGYQLINLGGDAGFVRQGAQDRLASARATLGPPVA